MERLMNEEVRKKHLDESHERAVRQAMFDATDDLIRRRKNEELEKQYSVETQFESVKKRLENLGGVKK